MCHWEFSIKFFVYARPPAGVESGLGRYVGPFLHENLEARLATSARKLRLSAAPDVRAWAAAALGGKDVPFRASSALRGFLFYDGPAPGDAAVSPAHLKGWCARDAAGVVAAAPAGATLQAVWNPRRASGGR